MSEQPTPVRPLFTQAATYADALRDRFGGAPSVDQLITVLGEEVLPFRGVVKRPAIVVFENHSLIRPRQLAFAIPDADRNPSRHTVYVREALRDDPDLALVLAHELEHTTFGKADARQDESDADRFGARLMGLTVEEFRDRVRGCGLRIGIEASGNRRESPPDTTS